METFGSGGSGGGCRLHERTGMQLEEDTTPRARARDGRVRWARSQKVSG